MSKRTDDLVAESLSTFQKTGGPAFPADWKLPDDATITCPGMTLRDWFAGQAMQAQVVTDMMPGEACDALIEAANSAGQDPIFRLALNSYEIADAMLTAREKGGAS